MELKRGKKGGEKRKKKEGKLGRGSWPRFKDGKNCSKGKEQTAGRNNKEVGYGN